MEPVCFQEKFDDNSYFYFAYEKEGDFYFSFINFNSLGTTVSVTKF